MPPWWPDPMAPAAPRGTTAHRRSLPVLIVHLSVVRLGQAFEFEVPGAMGQARAQVESAAHASVEPLTAAPSPGSLTQSSPAANTWVGEGSGSGTSVPGCQLAPPMGSGPCSTVAACARR